MRALLGLSTLTIVFLVLLLGPAIETYEENPENYTWIDDNGEFISSSYIRNNDMKIEVLNNKTLNEVFNEGNLFDIDNYQQNSTFPQRSNVDGVIKHEVVSPNSSSNFIGVVSSVIFSNHDRLYHNYEVKSFEENDRVRHYTRAYYGPYYSLVVGEWNQITNKNYFTSDTADDRIVINQAGGVNGSKTAGEFVYFRNVYIVNITDLGIDNNIDVEVLDFYHDLYVKNSLNYINNLGGDITSQWTSFNNDYLQPTIDAIALYVKWLTNPAGVFTDLLEDIIIIDTIG